ncbi:UBX domain-containing protein 1 [Bombina bombina]|uniref:UBX domain-containing protein 1 n=1 Tax=Bombina bombina TaxID=8345 RepID=UPI00235ABCE3|nr:UBX domain-containing protein 1 [Bombina bombina]
MSESSALESLLEMGFPANRAERALAATGNQGIESAMDWLMEHEDDPEVDEAISTEAEKAESAETTETTETTENIENTENMDTGPVRTSLTEEEKEKQTRRMMELIAQKQQEREEREKKERVEQEKQRRKQGQELSAIKQRMQEQEMQKAVEDRRREKQEERMARERVKEKIARDKAERARRFGGSSVDPVSPPAETSTPVQIPSPSSTSQEPPVKKEYDQCRIQVRLLDGSVLTQTFRAREQLAAVRLYVELNWPGGEAGPFNLLTSFPRRVFTEDDMEQPLQELGLVPSAVLIVARK